MYDKSTDSSQPAPYAARSFPPPARSLLARDVSGTLHFTRMRKSSLLLGFALAIAPFAFTSAAEDTRPIAGIMDNSFLVEEAYNQEAGVVQHITTAAYSHTRDTGESAWNFSFTQEWPFVSQRHQLSYTLPYTSTRDGGITRSGLGDVLLNYRYQAYLDEQTLTAFAPRLSVILPTGNARRGFGDDTTGLQVNLPFSTALNERWYFHANAGTTILPDAASAGGANLRHYNVGASVIYAATSTTHFLCEVVNNWTQEFDSGRSTRRPAVVLSPGVRHAYNLPRNLQIVVGAAVPLGLTNAAPDYGLFLYLSIEHSFGSSR